MSPVIKKCVVFLFLAAFVLSVGKFWYFSKDGFHINRIAYALPKKNIPEKDLSIFFQSPYHYLGRGRQCYVFVSQDDKYVLKIPRFDRYRLPFFWKAMPSFYDRKKKSIFLGRRDRLDFVLESFRLSAEELSEETAVLFLHFHQTSSLPARFVIYDRLHRPFTIDLNQTAFVLQEKKQLMMPLFLQTLRENRTEDAQKLLLAFLDIIDKRAQKGIFNRDPSFLKNFGWDGSKSIQIDIGSFWRKTQLSAQEAYSLSLIEGSGRVREWLAQTDPEMLRFYEEHLKERLNRGLVEKLPKASS